LLSTRAGKQSVHLHSNGVDIQLWHIVVAWTPSELRRQLR
jgi:hypothetical protein